MQGVKSKGWTLKYSDVQNSKQAKLIAPEFRNVKEQEDRTIDETK